MKKRSVHTVIRTEYSDPHVITMLDNGFTFKSYISEAPSVGEKVAVEVSWGADYAAPVVPIGTERVGGFFKTKVSK